MRLIKAILKVLPIAGFLLALFGCFFPAQMALIVTPETGFAPLRVSVRTSIDKAGGQYVFELFHIEDLAAGEEGRVLVSSITNESGECEFVVDDLPAIVVCTWGDGISGVTVESEIITEKSVDFIFHPLPPNGSSYTGLGDPMLRPYQRYYFNANHIVGSIETGVEATDGADWEITNVRAYGEDYAEWGYPDDAVFSPPYDGTEYHATPRAGESWPTATDNSFVIYPCFDQRYEQVVLRHRGNWKKSEVYNRYDRVKHGGKWYYCVLNHSPTKSDGVWYGYHTPGEDGSESYWNEITAGRVSVDGARLIAIGSETGYAVDTCMELGSPNTPGCFYHPPQKYFIEITVESGSSMEVHIYEYRLNAVWR